MKRKKNESSREKTRRIGRERLSKIQSKRPRDSVKGMGLNGGDERRGEKRGIRRPQSKKKRRQKRKEALHPTGERGKTTLGSKRLSPGRSEIRWGTTDQAPERVERNERGRRGEE